MKLVSRVRCQSERPRLSHAHRLSLESLEERLPPGDLAGGTAPALALSSQRGLGAPEGVRANGQVHHLRVSGAILPDCAAGTCLEPSVRPVRPEAAVLKNPGYPPPHARSSLADLSAAAVMVSPFAEQSALSTGTRRDRPAASDALSPVAGASVVAAPAGPARLFPREGSASQAAFPVRPTDMAQQSEGLLTAVASIATVGAASPAALAARPAGDAEGGAGPGSRDVGYVGCSMTLNAVGGYQQVGGTRIWTNQGNYGGGGITQWAEDLSDESRYWGSFRALLEANPNPAGIWWQLCTIQAHLDTDTLDNAVLVVQEINRRVPEAQVYVSAQPAYTDGHVCFIAGEDGPERMQTITEQLVQGGYAQAGPVVGPLSAAQTLDGCHANPEGRRLMGQHLVEFFDVAIRPAPSGVFCSCGPTTGFGEGSVATSIARLDFVTGILVRIGWNILEPSDDEFRWDLIDQQIERARQFGKTVTLAVVNGHAAPDWLYDEAGAQPFWYQFGGLRRMPVPWDEVYLGKWTELVAQLGARYQNDPTVVMVTITNSTLNGFEMQLPFTPPDLANWEAYGYNPDLVIASWVRSIDAFAAAFPVTPLELELHPVLFSDEVPYGAMLHAWSAHAPRIGAFAGWWSQWNTTVYPGPWELLQVGPYLSFSTIQMVTNATQNPDGFGKGGIQRAIDLAYDTGIRYMEIWNQDLLNPEFDEMLHELAERLRG